MNLKWLIGFVFASVGLFIPIIGWLTLFPFGRKLMKQAERDSRLRRSAWEAQTTVDPDELED